MNHIPVPEYLREDLVEVPYLGIAPKYDRHGFDGFLERVGTTKTQFTRQLADYVRPDAEADPNHRRLAALLSWLQEWCWFGLLHELEIHCNIPMDLSGVITAGGRWPHVLDTSFLPAYVRKVIVSQIKKHDIPLDLKVGDILAARQIHIDPGPYKILESRKGLWFLVENMSTGKTDLTLPSRLVRRTQSEQNTLGSATLVEKDELYNNIPLEDLSSSIFDLLVSQKEDDNSIQEHFSSTSDTRLARCVMEVNRLFRQPPFIGVHIIQSKTIDSLRLLCEAVQNVVQRAFCERIPLSFPPSMPVPIHPWCPMRTRELRGLLSPLLIEITRYLPSHDVNDHAGCSISKCVHTSTSASAIGPSHTQYCERENCIDVTVNEQEIVSIIDQGGSPCVLFHDDQSGQRLTIEDTRRVPYVAISHVWSHGLGNSSKNAMPWCQLRKLSGLVRDCTDSSTALWVDTLAVPLEPALKRKAIAQMRDIYSRARAVLVIDKHLEQVGPDPIEQHLQILSSEWMTRLWTLQEGRLAPKLLFKFRDAIVPLAELLQFDVHRSDRTIFADLRLLLAAQITPRFQEDRDVTRRFVELYDTLSSRKVSESADEPTCLATLLGLNFNELGPGDITMAQIYRALPDDIPLACLFVPAPRLREPGLRWAPSTFITDTLSRGRGTFDKGRLIIGGSGGGGGGSTGNINDNGNGNGNGGGLAITIDCVELESPFKFLDTPDDRWVYMIDLQDTPGSSSWSHHHQQQQQQQQRTMAFSVQAPFKPIGPRLLHRAAILLKPVIDTVPHHFSGVLVDIIDPDPDPDPDNNNVGNNDDSSSSSDNDPFKRAEFVSLVYIGENEFIPEMMHAWKTYTKGMCQVRGEFQKKKRFCVD